MCIKLLYSAPTSDITFLMDLPNIHNIASVKASPAIFDHVNFTPLLTPLPPKSDIGYDQYQ